MLNQQFRAVRKLAVRVIDGETVMMTLTDSKLHRLNETATRVWQLLNEGSTVEETAAAMSAEFEITTAKALREVRATTASLVELGILEPVAPEEG